MKKPHKKLNDLALENLFEVARAEPTQMPEGLMIRVIEDAQSLQPRAQYSGWRAWFAAIGGLPALGGLVTATCVGFWIGVAPPDGLSDLTGQVMGLQEYTELDAVSDVVGFGWDIEEGNADG